MYLHNNVIDIFRPLKNLGRIFPFFLGYWNIVHYIKRYNTMIRPNRVMLTLRNTLLLVSDSLSSNENESSRSSTFEVEKMGSGTYTNGAHHDLKKNDGTLRACSLPNLFLLPQLIVSDSQRLIYRLCYFTKIFFINYFSFDKLMKSTVL